MWKTLGCGWAPSPKGSSELPRLNVKPSGWRFGSFAQGLIRTASREALWRSSGLGFIVRVFPQGLQQLFVAGLVRVVRRLVFLRMLREDQRGLEEALAAPRAFDHGAPTLGEEIGRRSAVADGHRRLAVRERECQAQGLRLPFERAPLHHSAETVRLARDRGRPELARRHEVDHGLAHAGIDEITQGGDDDQAAGNELDSTVHGAPLPVRFRSASVRARTL